MTNFGEFGQPYWILAAILIMSTSLIQPFIILEMFLWIDAFTLPQGHFKVISLLEAHRCGIHAECVEYMCRMCGICGICAEYVCLRPYNYSSTVPKGQCRPPAAIMSIHPPLAATTLLIFHTDSFPLTHNSPSGVHSPHPWIATLSPHNVTAHPGAPPTLLIKVSTGGRNDILLTLHMHFPSPTNILYDRRVRR